MSDHEKSRSKGVLGRTITWFVTPVNIPSLELAAQRSHVTHLILSQPKPNIILQRESPTPYDEESLKVSEYFALIWKGIASNLVTPPGVIAIDNPHLVNSRMKTDLDEGQRLYQDVIAQNSKHYTFEYDEYSGKVRVSLDEQTGDSSLKKTRVTLTKEGNFTLTEVSYHILSGATRIMLGDTIPTHIRRKRVKSSNTTYLRNPIDEETLAAIRKADDMLSVFFWKLSFTNEPSPTTATAKHSESPIRRTN